MYRDIKICCMYMNMYLMLLYIYISCICRYCVCIVWWLFENLSCICHMISLYNIIWISYIYWSQETPPVSRRIWGTPPISTRNLTLLIGGGDSYSFGSIPVQAPHHPKRNPPGVGVSCDQYVIWYICMTTFWEFLKFVRMSRSLAKLSTEFVSACSLSSRYVCMSLFQVLDT